MSTLPQTLGELRRSSQFSEQKVRAPSREGRDARQSDGSPAQRRARSSPASSATTTPSSRSSSTRCCRGTTSSCSGLRGQAKSRILRALTASARRADSRRGGLRDQRRPARADLPALPRAGGAEAATRLPIAWLPRDARYVEKLATPDVTIADMIGDIDPIKAARGRPELSSELTMHYGLLPRANRGIFAHQRAARPRRQDSGRPVQHPAGRRRPD